MLKNKFRKLTGLLILAVFGVAIARFFTQTAGSPYVWSALAAGLKFTLFLAAVVWLVWALDRRMKKREQ